MACKEQPLWLLRCRALLYPSTDTPMHTSARTPVPPAAFTRAAVPIFHFNMQRYQVRGRGGRWAPVHRGVCVALTSVYACGLKEAGFCR